MTGRLDFVLYLLLIVTALGVVTSRHQARKLYVELQTYQKEMQQYDVEWGQLQLEQSTWAMHARIEKIARTYLQMQVPDYSRIQIVTPRKEN